MYYRYLFTLVLVIFVGPIQYLHAFDAQIAFRGGMREGMERPEFNRGEDFNPGDLNRDNLNRDEHIPNDARGNSFRRAGGAAAWGAVRGYEAGEINGVNSQYYNPYMYYYQPYTQQQQPYQQSQNQGWQQTSSAPN